MVQDRGHESAGVSQSPSSLYDERAKRSIIDRAYPHPPLPLRQIHISLEPSPATLVLRPQTRGHPCFTIPYQELTALRLRLAEFASSGHPGACTTPSLEGAGFVAGRESEEVNGAAKGDRFFVRDWVGNRIEIAGN